MKFSMSVTKGYGNQKHNMRLQDRHPVNVDRDRTTDNIVLRNDNMRDVYKSLFDESVREYNARQKRSDRKIKDYYSKIANSKKEKLFHELVIQIGSMDNNPSSHHMNDTVNRIYAEFLNEFEKLNPQFRVVGAYIHNDETTPHMHVDYVPVATYARGMKKRVANNRAIEQMGYKDWDEWRDRQFETLEQISARYDIQRENMNDLSRHMSVKMYKNIQNLASEQLSKDYDVDVPKISLNAVQARIGLNIRADDFYRKEEVDKTVKKLVSDLEDARKGSQHANFLLRMSQFEIDDLKDENYSMSKKPYREENDKLRLRINNLEQDNKKLRKQISEMSELERKYEEASIENMGLRSDLEKANLELSYLDRFLRKLDLRNLFEEVVRRDFKISFRDVKNAAVSHIEKAYEKYIRSRSMYK